MFPCVSFQIKMNQEYVMKLDFGTTRTMKLLRVLLLTLFAVAAFATTAAPQQHQPAKDNVPVSTEDRVMVKAIRITGNKRISDDILQAQVADAIGKNLSLSQLDELAGRITDYYYNYGSRGVRALIPAQSFTSGLVEIKVVVVRDGSREHDAKRDNPPPQIKPVRSAPPATTPAGGVLVIGQEDGARPSAVVTVKAIRIIGNRRFSDETLQALVADAIGQDLTLSQMDELAERITDYYYNHGSRRVRAFVPAQSFKSGLVKIKVNVVRRNSGISAAKRSNPPPAQALPAVSGGMNAPAADMSQEKPPKSAKPQQESAVARSPVAKNTPADISPKTTSPQQMAQFQYQKALSLLQEGRAAEAQDNLQKALETEPRHAATRELLAILQIDAGKPKQGEDLLQKGLDLSLEHTGLALILARLKISQGDLKGAQEVLRQSQQYAAEDADYQAMMAAVLQRTGQHEEAIQRYRVALRKKPDYAPWLVGMGISLQATGKHEEAIAAFTYARQNGRLGTVLDVFVKERLRELNQLKGN